MKKLIALMLLTGLLACQEPGVQPLLEPTHPAQPSATVTPIESPEPSQIPEPEPSPVPTPQIPTAPAQTAEPEPEPEALPGATFWPEPAEPVQELTVLDLTPEAFKNADFGSIRAMYLDRQAEQPALLIHYHEDNFSRPLSGLWQIRSGDMQRLLSPNMVDSHSLRTLQYHNGAMYALGKCPRRYLLSDLRQQRFQPELLACLPTAKGMQELYIASEQAVFSFGTRTALPEDGRFVRSSAYHLSRHQSDPPTELFTSQPVGVNKIVHWFLVHAEDEPCFGLCFPPHALSRGSSDGGMWTDRENNISYPLNGVFRQTYTRPVHNDNLDFSPDLVSERLPFIVDGPADRATFWQPSGLQQDRQGNFYVRDKVASEDLIRQISPDGQVRTLISANGLTDFGYPAFQHSLKALLPPAQQIEEQVEYITGFVVDRPRDWLYIIEHTVKPRLFRAGI